MLGEGKTMRIEDQYVDVLQNIEFGIVITYKQAKEKMLCNKLFNSPKLGFSFFFSKN